MPPEFKSTGPFENSKGLFFRFTDDFIPCILESQGDEKIFRRNWARLMQKICEADPLACPIRQGAMRIISSIEDPSVIRAILNHMGIWLVRSRPLPKIHSQPHRRPFFSGAKICLDRQKQHSYSSTHGEQCLITITHFITQSCIVQTHPDTGNSVNGIRQPHWDKLLMMASAVMEMTGLGYLGADVVLDRDKGPVLLELDARPGLAIQMANQSGLRRRLDKTDRALPAVFLSPKSRVAWARSQFTG